MPPFQGSDLIAPSSQGFALGWAMLRFQRAGIGLAATIRPMLRVEDRGGWITNTPVFGGSITGLTFEQCVSRLRKKPCLAKVADLNDSIFTMAGGGPSPYGCGRYLNASDCRGVVVGLLYANGAAESTGQDCGAGNPHNDPCEILY